MRIVYFALVLALALSAALHERTHAASFVRGDADGDGSLTVNDALLALRQLFLGDPMTCRDALDADDDGSLSITDAIVTLIFLTDGGLNPPSPFPECGDDETDDLLDCELHRHCAPTPGLIPVLFEVDGLSGPVHAGDVIVLRGNRFSPRLEENVVTFRAGSVRIRGAPLDLTFPTNACGQQASVLRVLVPTGVVSGAIELEIRGVFAGAVGFVAAPEILSFDMGEDGSAAVMKRATFIGFGVNPWFPSEFRLHGLNFGEVDEIRIADSSGGQVRLAPADFERRSFSPDNGLESLVLGLEDVRIAVMLGRDNVFVTVIPQGARANTVAVPVLSHDLIITDDNPLGPVINGVILPTAVRTGPVRLRYSIYDLPVNMSYSVALEWNVLETDEEWFAAAINMDDQESDGTDPSFSGAIVPGTVGLPNAAGLVRGYGVFRTVTWDAPNDENFRALNESPAPRNWTVQFRFHLRPVFFDADRRETDFLFETPVVAYYDLEERLGEESVQDLREAAFVEDFRNPVPRNPRRLEAEHSNNSGPFARASTQGART